MSTQACNPMRKNLARGAVCSVLERQHKLRQMVSTELILMRSVAIKLGCALLVLEGLFRLAAAGHPPPSGAATVVADQPPTAQLLPRTRISSMHATAPRLPRAMPVAR